MSLSSYASRLRHNRVRTITVFLLFGLIGCTKSLELGKVYDPWEASGNQFSVRVRAFEEHSQFLGGGYLLYESALHGTDRWQEIMGFRHDGAIKIPHESVHFVSDKIGYVFLGW